MSERTAVQRRRSEQATDGGRADTAMRRPSDAVRQALATPAGGMPLDNAARAYLEPRFGHDFGQVRIHADGQATAAAAGIDAAAFAVGADIFVHADRYAPDSPAGLRLLAHELTHVVQQDRYGAPTFEGGRTLSRRSDAAEREAEAAADRVAGGQAVAIQAAPSAPVALGLLDWVEDKASGAWDDVTSAASAVGGVASDVGSAVGSAASDVGSAIGGAASEAWDVTKQGASGIYDQMKKDAGYVSQGANWVEHGIDWAEDEAKSGTSWLAKKAEGIPVLEQLAHGAEWGVDTAVEVEGGVLKGATGLVGGVLGMAADPVDTVKGLETMAEHIPTIPGIPNPLKLAHGLYDVATGQEGLGDMANHVFNPLQSMKDDAAFGEQMVKGIIKPYQQEIAQGKYAEAAGRGIFDIGSIVLTGGAGAEAEGAADVARAAEVAGDVTKGVEVATDATKAAEVATDATKAAEVASDAAKGEEAVTDASKMSEADQAATRTAGSSEPSGLDAPEGDEANSGLSQTTGDADGPATAGADASQPPDAFLGGLKRWRIRAGETSRGVTDAIRAEIKEWASKYGTIDGPPTTGSVHAGHTWGGSHVFTLPGEETQVAAQTARGNLAASAAEKAAAEARRAWNLAHPDGPLLPVRPRGG